MKLLNNERLGTDRFGGKTVLPLYRLVSDSILCTDKVSFTESVRNQRFHCILYMQVKYFVLYVIFICVGICLGP